jgi:chondroitin sulfate proteoglycan 4
VISYCSDGIKNYSHIILDINNNQIIVAARSELSLLPYNLSSALVIRKNVSAAASDIFTCRLTKSEEACHNYFKLLLKDGSGNVIACGTYAEMPKCRFYNETTLSDTTPSAWKSIKDFNGYVPKSPESSNTAVFTVNGSLIVGSPRRPSAHAISRFTPGGKALNLLTVISGTDARRWLDTPDFVSSYEIGEYVYVFLRETALERDSKYEYSRLARVCKNDAGDTFLLDENWVSFVKSEISCEVPVSNPPYRYSRVVGTTLINKAMHNPDAVTQDMFYAVFTGAIGSPIGSAVCAYGLNGQYMNDISSVYNGQYYYWDNGFKTATPNNFKCDPARSPVDAKKYQLTVNPVKQVTAFPLYAMDGVSATAIAVDQVTVNGKIYDVIFLGFDDGRIQKISPVKSSSSWETKVTETITVAMDEPILQLRVLSHSNLSKRLLFVVSSSKVSQLPLQRCDRYNKCSDCISAQDPFCGWLSTTASCVTSDTHGAVQNVMDGKYDSLCPKAPATFSLVLQKKTSDSVTVMWLPDSSPSQPYSKPSFRLYKGGQSIGKITVHDTKTV